MRRAIHGWLACAWPALALAAPTADTVFVHGAVYTVDAARSWASAVAVAGPTIVYVGDDRTARTYIGPHTRVVDLDGRMLLPGFQDSHVHPALAPNTATQLNVDGLATRAAIVARIREFATAHPDAAWIVGTGWQEAAFLPSGQPTRAMLDEAVPDRPAYLTNNSQHMGWANTRALAAAHVDARTGNPANGRIERDAAGQPTGVLQEAAKDLVERVMPPPTTAEQAENLAAAMREMHRVGITAYEDALARPGVLPAYAELAHEDRIAMRTHVCQYFDPAQDDAAQLAEFERRRAEFVALPVRADCVKVVLDGAYGSHTVALLQPYADEPAKFGDGKLFVEPARLARLVTRLDAAGFQVHVHAIGDRAVHVALDAIAAARRANGDGATRHTIAHLGLIADADIPRFRALGVVANMSPLWSRGDPWETVFAPKLFGPSRSQQLYRTRTLLDAGTVLAWGSDWPVTGLAPLAGIETAVTRRYPGGRDEQGKEDTAWIPAQRVTLAEAIAAYTAAGAWLVSEEDRRGSIVAGKLADLVVLSRNLFTIDPLTIHAVDVDLTMVGGKVVFERR